MAHFAKIDSNNKVETVIVAPDQAYVDSLGGRWIQTSYNTSAGVHGLGGTPLRANYPGGAYDEDDPWYYDGTNDIFHKGRPKDKDNQSCTSWTLNTTTGQWGAPLTRPEETREEILEGKCYVWDESAYQADNSKGWVLV